MQTQHLNYKPFTFRDFSEAEAAPATEMEMEPEEVNPPEPEAARISEEELRAAKEEAYAAGYVEGIATGRQQIEAEQIRKNEEIHNVLGNIAGEISSEIKEFRKKYQEEKQVMAQLSLMMARKIAGKVTEMYPLSCVEDMLSECLAMLAGESRVVIHVSGELAPLLEEKLAELARHEQEMVVKADPAMQQGDCRISWPGGKAERSQKDIWHELEQIIDRALVSASNG